MIRERHLDAERGPILQHGDEVAPGYEVVAHLHRGKRLDVYDVWSVDRACRCIAKTITPDRVEEDKARVKLIAEGRLLLGLAHPNIVRAYELTTGETSGTPVLILETLTGRTLSHLIDEFPDGMAVEDVVWLGLHLCSAVGYLHSNGYLHLDIKPDNIISEAGRAKLIDLSISEPEGFVSPGSGTHDYLSPEQARGERVIPATDVWGIGVTLYEAMTGTVPFEFHEDGGDGVGLEVDLSESTDASREFAPDSYPQATERAPRVGTRRESINAPLADLIDACLEPVAADRPGVRRLMEGLARAGGVDPRQHSP